MNRNNIILITEAFNVITDSSERVKYDREYKNYLENKDEIDKNEKNERENRRREREEKIVRDRIPIKLLQTIRISQKILRRIRLLKSLRRKVPVPR